MPDYSILQQHAAQHVWCNPSQDKQLIFKTARLTPTYGTRQSFTAMKEKHTVPTPGSKFHVFKIGYLSETEINIKLSYQWVRVSTLCNNRNMLIDIYLAAGLMLPRSECWIKNTANGALILAIKQDRLIEFNTTDAIKTDVLMTNTPSIKFYSNRYFGLAESQSNPRDVYVYGRKIELSSDTLTFSEQYTTYVNAAGSVYAYINGWYVADFTPAKITVGDYVEMVYDSSIIISSSVAKSNIPTFTSTLTNDDRHFITSPIYQDNIWFYDDIDFYLVGTGTLSGRGLYISRDIKHTIRMMTHAGFSISDEAIQSLLNSTIPSLASAGSYRIHYVVRNSGLTRKLTSSRNRLNRFMYLAKNDPRTPEFKYENNLPLTEWKYANIEAADINTLYGTRYDKMTSQLIKDAYGYHTAARSLTPSTQPVIIDIEDQSRSVVISPVYVYGCTVFEYDVNGLLLEYHTHTGTDSYVPVNEDTTWVEIVTGLATDGTGVGDEDSVVAINTNFEYRFFSGPEGELEDVTGSAEYIVDGTTATWASADPGEMTLVLNDQYFFCREFVTNPDESVIAYDIGYYVDVNGTPTFHTSNVPVAEVDVWLNNHPLVEGIDYHVVWPRVVVTNINHQLADKAPNKVLVRGRGHGDVTKGYVSTTDSGFVKWGLFSVNDRYDVHWDQSLKAVVNGLAVIPDNIVYTDDENETVYFPAPGIFEAEASNLALDRVVSGSTVTTLGVSTTHPLNGKPYSLRDSYSGLTVAVPGSTRDYRLEILDFDKRLSNFLTYKLPASTPLLPNVIVAKYPVVSPFTEACMDGLLNETIDSAVWDKFDYDTDEVLTEMSEHTYLLGADVTQDSIYNKLDPSIADICAHPYPDKVSVNFNQFRFLEFVAHELLNDRVDISRFFSIGMAGWEPIPDPDPVPEFLGWVPLPPNFVDTPDAPNYIFSYLTNNSDGTWVAMDGNGTTVRSTDDARTWVSGVLRFGLPVWDSIYFPVKAPISINSTGLGFASNHQGATTKTTDGGFSWQAISTFTDSFTTSKCNVLVLSENGTIVQAQNSSMRRSTDAGVTWTESQPRGPYPYIIGQIQALDTDNNGVWVLGGGDTSFAPHIGKFLVRSIDDGVTWIPVDHPAYDDVYDIEYVGNDTWIAAGLGVRSILRSTDNGATWNLVNLPILDEWRNVKTIATNYSGAVVIGGIAGSAVVSSDLGATWTDISLRVLDWDNLNSNPTDDTFRDILGISGSPTGTFVAVGGSYGQGSRANAINVNGGLPLEE